MIDRPEKYAWWADTITDECFLCAYVRGRVRAAFWKSEYLCTHEASCTFGLCFNMAGPLHLQDTVMSAHGRKNVLRQRRWRALLQV